jgi:hypothetical protein
VRELRTGIWHWQAAHPDWQPSAPWQQDVSSYAIDDGERLLLFDPLALPSELEELATGRETAIVLTAPWHERDTKTLVERLGLPVFTPLPEIAEDLMQKYGVTAEQAGDGSPDLRWLFREQEGHARPYAPGERPLAGVQAFPSRETNEAVLWIEDQRAVVAGDTLVDFGEGLEVPLQWLSHGVTREQVVEGLRPLLELPVELVLPTHGGPTDRAALERVLA